MIIWHRTWLEPAAFIVVHRRKQRVHAVAGSLSGRMWGRWESGCGRARMAGDVLHGNSFSALDSRWSGKAMLLLVDGRTKGVDQDGTECPEQP